MDDSSFLPRDDDPIRLINTSNSELQVVYDTSYNNTCFFIKRTSIKTPDIPLEINCQPLLRVRRFKFLGTYLDEHLIWSSHRQYISNKITK